MKIRVLLLLLVLTLQSCMYQQADSLANKDIKQSLRNTIKAKNDSLFYAMANSSNKMLLQLGTPDFKKFMHARLNKVLWAFSRKNLDINNYSVFDEFYNTHSTVPDNSVITSEEHGYTFTFQNNEKETYVSMLKFTVEGIDDFLITVIYNRIGNDWKVEDIEGGQLGIYGKTANDLFNEAKKYKQNNFPLDAFFYMDAAKSFLRPAGKMLVYDLETKLNLYAPIWTNEVNSLYQFPYALSRIITLPEVQEITCVKNPEGFYPLISYTTIIPVNDTVALKKEFEEVKREVKKTYTGIDFNKPAIYYRAYNLIPGSHEPGDSYTFKDKR